MVPSLGHRAVSRHLIVFLHRVQEVEAVAVVVEAVEVGAAVAEAEVVVAEANSHEEHHGKKDHYLFFGVRRVFLRWLLHGIDGSVDAGIVGR